MARSTHPDHVESLTTGDGNRDAVPRCSCGWIGEFHKFGERETAQRIIADFVAHRETYAAPGRDTESKTAS